MVMEKSEMPSSTPLPRVIKALGEGCSLAAEKVYLMAVPFVLDLFLFFGPKLRISDYFWPMFEAAFRQTQASLSSGMMAQLEASLDVIREFLRSVNLFGFIQTHPVGVSVMNAASGPETPLGKSAEFQMSSILQILPVILFMTILGILLGTVYFSLTAAAAAPEKGKNDPAVFGKQLLNTVLMYIALAVLLAVLAVPVTCGMTFSMLAAPLFYQLFILLMIAAACWLIIPLFYIPHEIFVNRLDFPRAFRESLRMGSWSGTITVRFIILSAVISLGMDMIWAIPEQSSWLILFSIFGRAYVTTALLAGSFILFRDLDRWQNENRAFLEWRKANLRFMKLVNMNKETENHD